MIKTKISLVNNYLARKQHLLPASHIADLIQVTRDIAALHATVASGPYLSLWARVPAFKREALEDILYEQRKLARVLCMRRTVHAVPSDELAYFFQAYAQRWAKAELRDAQFLLPRAGLCQPKEAGTLLKKLQRKALAAMTKRESATTQEIGQMVPESKAQVRHDVGKAYEGQFSVSSYIVRSMCAMGALIRARPRGNWRSNLYEYATLSHWLPDVDLQVITPQEAQTWLVRRYLSAFGPTTFEDIQWWSGFTKSEARQALKRLGPEVVAVAIQELGDDYLMLVDGARQLSKAAALRAPHIFLLPSLDPYIMGYQDRRRFLKEEQRAKIFDRAGNSVPTVWVDGQIAGAWGQRQDGSVTYRLFEPAADTIMALLEKRVQQLEAFLGGEYIPPPFRTPFTRDLD